MTSRVERYRRSLYPLRGGNVLSDGCILLLLRLSEDMNANGIVSVPRSKLAADLNCPPARITEWISQAIASGRLARVRRARPNVTAVYQGLYVNPRHDSEVRTRVPQRGTPEPLSDEVRTGVPQSQPTRYATDLPQEVVATATGSEPNDRTDDKEAS